MAGASFVVRCSIVFLCVIRATTAAPTSSTHAIGRSIESEGGAVIRASSSEELRLQEVTVDAPSDQQQPAGSKPAVKYIQVLKCNDGNEPTAADGHGLVAKDVSLNEQKGDAADDIRSQQSVPQNEPNKFNQEIDSNEKGTVTEHDDKKSELQGKPEQDQVKIVNEGEAFKESDSLEGNKNDAEIVPAVDGDRNSELDTERNPADDGQSDDSVKSLQSAAQYQEDSLPVIDDKDNVQEVSSNADEPAGNVAAADEHKDDGPKEASAAEDVEKDSMMLLMGDGKGDESTANVIPIVEVNLDKGSNIEGQESDLMTVEDAKKVEEGLKQDMDETVISSAPGSQQSEPVIATDKPENDFDANSEIKVKPIGNKNPVESDSAPVSDDLKIHSVDPLPSMDEVKNDSEVISETDSELQRDKDVAMLASVESAQKPEQGQDDPRAEAAPAVQVDEDVKNTQSEDSLNGESYHDALQMGADSQKESPKDTVAVPLSDNRKEEPDEADNALVGDIAQDSNPAATGDSNHSTDAANDDEKPPAEQASNEPVGSSFAEEHKEADKSMEGEADNGKGDGIPDKDSTSDEQSSNVQAMEPIGEVEEESPIDEPEEKKDYTGYRVYRVTIPTEEAAKWILKFEDFPGVEFWADPKLLLRPRGFFVTSAADILAAPDVVEYLEEAFRQARLPFVILIRDVQEAILNENPTDPLDEELMERIGHRMTWDRYHNFADIESYLDYLEITFPSFVSVVEIGRSTEKRPLRVVKLHQDGGLPNKKAIFIDAGIHAREWITPATITYMINEIVENPDKYKCIMDQFDWYFLPVINPDGYEFSHNTNRMWRKTRSQPQSIVFRKTAEESLRADRVSRFEEDPVLDDAILDRLHLKLVNDRASLSCKGTDANRNFGHQWLTGGSSRNPCVETYAGLKAFSEPETQAMADFILENKDKIAMYISLHAYSQMWLLPWGYTGEKPDDYSELYSLAKVGAQALQEVNGVDYLIGTIPDLLYIASGSSIDWAKAVAGIKYSYTLELRDAGRYGFILPANQIIPSGKETWIGLYATARELGQRIYPGVPACSVRAGVRNAVNPRS